MESVHLTVWPEFTEELIDHELEAHMILVRKVVELGHAKRKEKQLKVKQPLQKVIVYPGDTEAKFKDELEYLIKDELNVKEVDFQKGSGELQVELDTQISPKLQAEGHARDIVRSIQEERKKLGTTLSELIDVELPEWPKDFESVIKKKALIRNLQKGDVLKVVRV